MMTPEMLAKSGSEHAHQAALFCWAALPEQKNRWPELELMFAIPNGGERNLKVAANLKAEGVKPGVLDVLLPVPQYDTFYDATHMVCAGLFIEMKVKPNKPSDKQVEFATSVTNLGYKCVLCYSWSEAALAISKYMELVYVNRC